MEIELNSASDNPLVLVDEGAIVSVGNFDITSLAMAFDHLRLGIAHAAQVANERVQKLLWQHFSGLPTGLARQDRPTGGLRPLGARSQRPRRRRAFSPTPCRWTTAASWPRASRITPRWRRWRSASPRRWSASAHRLVALELIIAAQGVDLRGGPGRLGAGTARAYAVVREVRRQPDRRD